MSIGLSSQELAEKLFVSCETIRTHRRNLMLKMDARNVAHLIRLAYESNILRIESYRREHAHHYAN
jgi:DNA-binding CsgD family transcriptional regulator